MFGESRPIRETVHVQGWVSASYPERLRAVLTHAAPDQADAWLRRFVAPEPAAECVDRWLRGMRRRWRRGERTDLLRQPQGPTNRMPLQPDALMDRLFIRAWIEPAYAQEPLRVVVERHVPHAAVDWEQWFTDPDATAACVRDWLADLPRRWDLGERIRHRYPGAVIPDDDPAFGLEALGLIDPMDDLTEDERRELEREEAEYAFDDLLDELNDEAFRRDEFIPDVLEDEEVGR